MAVFGQPGVERVIAGLHKGVGSRGRLRFEYRIAGLRGLLIESRLRLPTPWIGRNSGLGGRFDTMDRNKQEPGYGTRFSLEAD